MLALLNRHLAQPLMAWKAHSPHLRYLQTLERTQFDSLDVQRERQLRAVQALVRHAWDSVPYYRDTWHTLGLHPEEVRSLDDLQAFPVLTKSDLRTQGERLLSSAYAGQKLHTKATSGSTGVPLVVRVDADAQAWKRAATLRSDQWSGWMFGTRVARLWGHGVVEQGNWKARLRRRLVERESYLNTLNVTDERMAAFVAELRAKPPGLLFGHAHSLYLFACYVRKQCPGVVRPDGIISAAMMLHDWQRTVIEEAFQQRVTNRYGCEEVSLVACECAEQRGLHINAEGVYVEVIPDTHLEGGRLLLTDLRNRAMPLIRYQVGDVAVPSTRACACGRGLPLLEKLVGRDADYVLTPSGELISGISLTDHFATAITGAAQVQLVQEELHCLRIRLVPDECFTTASHTQIATLVQDTFGPTMNHMVEVVTALPQEPSGKYRFCISPVATAYLQARAT